MNRKYSAIIIFNDIRMYMDVEAKNFEQAFYSIRDRLSFHNMRDAVVEHLSLNDMSDRNG